MYVILEMRLLMSAVYLKGIHSSEYDSTPTAAASKVSEPPGGRHKSHCGECSFQADGSPPGGFLGVLDKDPSLAVCTLLCLSEAQLDRLQPGPGRRGVQEVRARPGWSKGQPVGHTFECLDS